MMPRIPGELLEKVKGQDIQSFMQTQLAATQAGVMQAEAMTRATALAKQTEQFGVEQARLEATSVLEALLQLYRMTMPTPVGTGMSDQWLEGMRLQRDLYNRSADTQLKAMEMEPLVTDPYLRKLAGEFDDNLQLPTDQNLYRNLQILNEWDAFPEADADGKVLLGDVWAPRYWGGGKGLGPGGKIKWGVPFSALMRAKFPAYELANRRISRALKVSMTKDGRERVKIAQEASGEWVAGSDANVAYLDISDANVSVRTKNIVYDMTKGVLDNLLVEFEKKGVKNLTPNELIQHRLLESIGNLEAGATRYARAQIIGDIPQDRDVQGLIAALLYTLGIDIDPHIIVKSDERKWLNVKEEQMNPIVQARQVSDVITRSYAPAGPAIMQAAQQIQQTIMPQMPASTDEARLQTLGKISEWYSAQSESMKAFMKTVGEQLVDDVSEYGIPNELENRIFGGSNDPESPNARNYLNNELRAIGTLYAAQTDVASKEARRRADVIQQYILDLDVSSTEVDGDIILAKITRDLFRVMQSYGIYSAQEEPIIGWATIR